MTDSAAPQVGDTATLISGGPTMTVIDAAPKQANGHAYATPHVTCMWFTETSGIAQHTFPLAVLKGESKAQAPARASAPSAPPPASAAA